MIYLGLKLHLQASQHGKYLVRKIWSSKNPSFAEGTGRFVIS